MKELPKITIITVVRNDPAGFLMAARSILEQDYPNIEWVVVDGLSTDDTRHYINSLSQRIDALKIEKDNGIYQAMNKGILMATGDWIFFMNAGDVFHNSSTVTRYVDNLRQDDDIVYSDVSQREKSRIHIYRPMHRYFLGMTFDHQTACVRSSVYKSLMYDESYRIAGDFDFFSRARLKNYSFRKIPWFIGCRKSFLSGVSSNFIERQTERVSVVKKYFDYSKVKHELLREYKTEFRKQGITYDELLSLQSLLEQ